MNFLKKSLGVSVLLPALAACDAREIGTSYSAVDRDRVEIIRLMSNVRFAGSAFATGETFELVRLSGGQQIVIMDRTPNTTDLLVSVVGPLVSSSSQWAVALNDELCTYGVPAAVSGQRSPSEGGRVYVFEGYSASDPNANFESDAVFCFEPVE